MPAYLSTLFLCTSVRFLLRASARWKALRTTRSTPNRVLRLTSVATSCGVSTRIAPPLPVYGPSVPSRTTTRSMAGFPASGPVTPGYSLAGRRLMWWSSAKRVFNNSPRSSTPLGTAGSPMAPSRMASCPRSSSSTESGISSPVAR
ncbi:Uncharacterised protein [Mycobacteroides abscessus]|nr:Uncharacterised protein [Mycobacteroides abscessus]